MKASLCRRQEGMLRGGPEERPGSRVDSEGVGSIPAQLLALPLPWAAAYQAPLSMGFSRQKYWSGVPLPYH